MIAIWYSAECNAIWSSFRDMPFLPRSLMASLNGDTITITQCEGDAPPVIVATYDQIVRRDWTPFPDGPSCLAYLNVAFGTSRSDAMLAAAAPVFAGYGLMYRGPDGGIHADPTVPGYVFAGVATQNGVAGETVIARKRDTFRFSPWAWEPGAPVYVVPGGVLTQALPDIGILHQVGSALDATTLLIAPGDIIQL